MQAPQVRVPPQEQAWMPVEAQQAVVPQVWVRVQASPKGGDPVDVRQASERLLQAQAGEVVAAVVVGEAVVGEAVPQQGLAFRSAPSSQK